MNRLSEFDQNPYRFDLHDLQKTLFLQFEHCETVKVNIAKNGWLYHSEAGYLQLFVSTTFKR